MRTLVALCTIACLHLARPAEACVQLPEANKLLGWSKDGKLAVHARVDASGKLTHAELHPTRHEGWKYLVLEQDGAIVIKKVAVGSCRVFEADDHQRVAGKLTEAALRKLPIVAALELVAPPDDDGGAAKLSARFTPNKRYAEHKVEIRDGKAVVATLPVPVWCVGSCLRDEAFTAWGATVTHVAKAGDRTLYVIRMTKVCNAANDKELWMERVIAVPGKEAAPRHGRCRGSG
jgi:hypothetical protein